MRSIAVALVMVVAATGVHAADRAWQTGAWAKPLTFAEIGTPFRNLVIETDDVRLEVQEALVRGRVPLAARSGTPVTFAISANTVYVRQGAGERALHLLKRAQRPKAYGAAGGGHFVQSVGDGGLTVTLEDGSVWDLDPRRLDRTAH